MNILARFSPLAVAVILAGGSLGHSLSLADELPTNTNKIKSLTPEQARKLAEEPGAVLYLDGLTTLDAATAKSLAESKAWNGDLSAVTAFDFPDSVAIAQALAKHKGPLSLPNLKKISPKTLSALIAKQDVEIPLIETLELIPEPDGGATEDFIIPKWLEERQEEQRRQQAAGEAE